MPQGIVYKYAVYTATMTTKPLGHVYAATDEEAYTVAIQTHGWRNGMFVRKVPT